MMRRIAVALVLVGLGWTAGSTGAHEEHEREAASPKEQTLTGEVVDVVCYLSHGKDGLGKGHADCAKKCIKSGLPVALKVGDQLYLAVTADHTAANAMLEELAGGQVTVRGSAMERDGQHLIAISKVEKTQSISTVNGQR